MRKILWFIAVSLLLVCGTALSESNQLMVTSPETVRPGRAVLLSFFAHEAGEAKITVESATGDQLAVIADAFPAQQGDNYLWWNGTFQGLPLPEGNARLTVALAQQISSVSFIIGPLAPYLTAVNALTLDLTPDSPLSMTLFVSENGRLTTGLEMNGAWQQLATWAVTAGENEIAWSPSDLPDCTAVFTVLLTDEEGESSDRLDIPVSLSGFMDDLIIEEVLLDEVDVEHFTSEVDEIAGDTDNEASDSEEELEDHAETAELPIEDVPPDTSEENDQSRYTPNWTSPYYGQDSSMNYWTLPMDITNEAAVWEMLMQPMTVLDTGKANAQKSQITIRSEPDENAEGVGVVTCVSQGVHVLGSSGDWTLIECYSASFHNSKVKAWNRLVQGWVQSKYLRTVTPDPGMGLVVDKLTQRLYIFMDGHLYDTLLISTGLTNAKQPYNETRSGEFVLLVPAVGGFRDGKMICSYAIRFNSGDLLHEVPHSEAADGTKYYGTYAPKLGQKASHGCIRVQAVRTPKEVNMKWIWDHKKNNTKIVIWEDWQGRQMAYPSNDTILYYNPSGGTMYHSSETCYSAKGKTFAPFSYSELDTGDYAKLKRCNYCTPVLRISEIDAINANYLPGGDHDPVMTKALQKLGLIP